MELFVIFCVGFFYLLSTIIRSMTMKGVGVVLGMFAIIMFANNKYDIDLLKGKIQFSSEETAIEEGYFRFQGLATCRL